MEFKPIEGGELAKIEIGNSSDLASAIYEITLHAIKRGAQDAGTACDIAGSASLGGVLNLALLLCKKPSDFTGSNVTRETALEIHKSVTPELMIYASLIVAHQFHSIQDHDNKHMKLHASFSFALFGHALAQWQKLYPNLMIEDYVESQVAIIAKTELNNPENFNPVKDFDRRFLMRNNGSVN